LEQRRILQQRNQQYSQAQKLTRSTPSSLKIDKSQFIQTNTSGNNSGNNSPTRKRSSPRVSTLIPISHQNTNNNSTTNSTNTLIKLTGESVDNSNNGNDFPSISLQVEPQISTARKNFNHLVTANHFSNSAPNSPLVCVLLLSL
jgi:hypothetical protein